MFKLGDFVKQDSFEAHNLFKSSVPMVGTVGFVVKINDDNGCEVLWEPGTLYAISHSVGLSLPKEILLIK